jgi:thiol-disulfide isomerase/thioredoxin
MLYRRRWVIAATLSLVALACEPSERIEVEATPPKAQENRSGSQVARPVEIVPASTASLPVVGDPLGLLSKKPKTISPAAKRDPSVLDPGALANPNAQARPAAAPERDPRALARASSVIINRTASTTIRDFSMADVRNAVLARPQPHVLFFYGSYCPACRDVMPKFVQTVRGYGGPAGITAVSIEESRDAFAAYVPALGGVIEPLLLARGGSSLRKSTEELGVTWSQARSPDSVSIPYIAIFDARGRVVRQGGSREVARLEKTLREL